MVANAVLPARKPRRARVFVVAPDGYVALIERRRGNLHYWAVPGGGIEPGESAEQAARREVCEELGLNVTLGRRIGHIGLRGAQVFYSARVQSRQELSLGGPEQQRNRPGNSYRPVWVPIETAAVLWLRPPGSALALARLQKEVAKAGPADDHVGDS